MQVLKSNAEVRAARRILLKRQISGRESGMDRLLRRLGLKEGIEVGDFIKSWDILRTVEFLEQHVARQDPVLDIGAYASEILVALHKAGYANLHGADLDERLVAMPHADAIDYRVCNFMATPFADASFKAITAVSVIEHGFDADRLLTETTRLLQPGGYFIASFDYWQHKIDTTGIKFFGMSWCIFSEEEVLDFIERARTFGLVPVGSADFDGGDAFVHFGGKRYTFGWLVLQKA